MASMICCFVFVIFVSQTTASHFRGGIITWRPDEYIGNKINFNFRLGFRRSSSNSYFCDSAMVAQQRIVGSGGVWSASHDRGHYGSRTVADTGYHCTDFSVSEDWTQGENTFNYTFPDDGPWLVSYSGCCWISLANGSRSWFLSTTVNLTRRQDNGKINSSPISALSPIVRHQQGCSKTIFIPAEDSDGDKVRCRWSAGSQRECGGVCQRFSSSGTLDEEKCTLRLHSNAALGWHAVAITLEDFPASTTNFHTATPFSHVSLQFLVHVSSSSGPCNRAPLLIGQSPNDGSCEEVPDGGIFYSIIEAKHIDSSRRIAEIITVTPLYMRLTNLLNYTDNVGDNVYYKNVSWSPKSSQKGRHIFCFKAIDYHGVESDQRCITILVGTSNTPRPILSTRTPLIPTLYWPWGSKSVDFNITFDQQIKRPRHSKFIRIILQGHVIYKLDTRSSSDVSIDQNGFTLRFSVPQVVMSMRGNYSVTMDRGAVVGLGCTSDGPPTPGIGSTTSWPFSVGVCSQGTFIADGYNCDDVDECSNPPSIVSRKKRNIWYWPYRSATPLLPGSSASIASAVSVSGWMKYSQNTTWCTFAGRSLISSYVNIIQCQRYCEARVGCNAIEYWEGRHGYSICHECTDTSKITPYNNENDSGYPVYVWIKIGFTRPLPASFAIQSTAAIYSPPNLLTSSPTASSAAITSAASLSGWMKYSQNTTWCTFAGRSFISSYVNIIQCQRYCEARVGCNAIEYWEGRERYCYECTDTSKITSYNNAYAWAYPVYVWIKIGFTRPLPASFAIQSTAAIYSPPNLLPSSPTASSAAITSAASLSGWMKYSQNTTWCTFAGRSFISSYVNIIQCQRYCEARVGCNAIEYWEGRERYCYECTDTSKITSYNNAYAWAYPVYVWIKIGFTRPLPASFAIQSTAAIYSPPNLLTSSPTESLSRKSFTTTPLPAVSSATYASPYLFKSSPTSEFLKESLKGSVDIQASTAMVIPTASRVPFVLHLPANCQHNCVNTWGSFYCRCRQGYKLQADGKTCEDINECETQNGGCTHQCTNTPGSHYCKCREGTTMSIDNKTCHEPGINVRCTDNAMSISLERKSFKGFNPNTLTLLYSSCRASYNDTHITLRTSLNDCGTTHNESEDAITFYNEVRSVQFSPGTVITREQNVSIPFYCSFGRKAIVRNPSFKTWKNYVTSAEGGYGNFTFTMDMFKTSNYYSPYGYNDYPITVNLQDRLFLQIAVKSHQSNLVVFVDTCRATPSTDPYAVPQYIFIQRGCGLDSTLNYSYSINSKQRFSIQAFLFIQDHPVVHFHCEVLACHRNTARSRCLQGCSRSRGRRDEDPGSESTQVYEMSSGPIKFQKTNPGKMDKSTDVQTNMGLVTGVAAAGGIFLFLAIALAVAVVLVKKRFKGALADRNRAYAMEQFSKYVKEEKDNDGFSQDDDVNESGEQNFNKNAST
ncbi:uncharacterized protein LOC114949673 isoform X9 [Acropora millepora]|uniref:uncharacterized protein LOC114949673 isoform X9 n=1 Tax=Acropora millepora TaxID=45264 RepID=UPI001CF5F676|nr:uncharacterized protein LOC114949673 isoform X9 [Acropora millepora]